MFSRYWRESFKIWTVSIFSLLLDEIVWLREEALADIAAIDMIDLPLSDDEGDFEESIKYANGNYAPWVILSQKKLNILPIDSNT